jgi:hypothetical protein
MSMAVVPSCSFRAAQGSSARWMKFLAIIGSNQYTFNQIDQVARVCRVLGFSRNSLQ